MKLFDEWKSYESEVVPKEAPSVQREESFTICERSNGNHRPPR